jgi:arginine N-succinyltransferase
MLVIRPVRQADLDQLCTLAKRTGFGLTTLPHDVELLRERIAESEASFARMSRKARGETYLFVMEDLATGAVVGTSGIISKVGGFEPFYAYRVETELLHSEMLGLRKKVQTLHLVEEHNGPCEIGSLFLIPEYRRNDNGRLLSLSRFMFIGMHRERFDPSVIAEMRGVLDERGQSAFWDAIGRHFFDIDYPTADYLSMVNKKFIADLMPEHPVYVSLLPPAAQAVIGQVHSETRPALKLLQDEGFTMTGMVDIFEAGPMVSCARDEIRTVRELRPARIGELATGAVDGPNLMLATRGADYRACIGVLGPAVSGRVSIARETAEALKVKVGDEICSASLRSARTGKRDWIDVYEQSFHSRSLD